MGIGKKYKYSLTEDATKQIRLKLLAVPSGQNYPIMIYQTILI